jgi:hypothetical protein
MGHILHGLQLQVIVAGLAIQVFLHLALSQAPATQSADHIRRLDEHYAKIYAEPMASKDRLPKLIAIMSLSRIDAPAINGVLHDAMQREKDSIVVYLAWEALHARHASLSDAQRRRWVRAGLDTAIQGGFPGSTVEPLLRALAEHSAVVLESAPQRLALRVLHENSLDEEPGRATLDALRDLVTAWHDPVMVRFLINEMKQKDLADRIDYVLSDLPNPPKEIPASEAAWNKWLLNAKLQVAEASSLSPYKGSSTVFPTPAKITDPSDRRWKAELEVGALTVTDFDLVWGIDSTGSMNDVNQLVAKETGRIMRVCSLISRKARCGVVYFRHETEAKLMKPCCTTVSTAGNPKWYLVKPYLLTDDSPKLVKTMAAEPIPPPNKIVEGNMHPGGAVNAALRAAIGEMPWSKDKNARRVILLVGDSMITPDTETETATLATDAKKHGYLIHALLDGNQPTWNPVLQAAGGKILYFNNAPNNVPPAPSVFTQLAIEVIRGSVSKDYHDRVDPLVKILVRYAAAMEAAESANP